MLSWRPSRGWLLVGFVSLAGWFKVMAEPPVGPAAAPPPEGAAVAEDTPSAEDATGTADPTHRVEPVSLEQARERAKLLHQVYAATLEAVHTNYFEGCRGVAPARAMKDIFRDVEQESGIQARWISASFKAMNIGHEPQTEFEKHAALELARGADPVETVEEGFYRRAAGVPFQGSCIGCHSENFGSTSPRRKYAGLIISIPVIAEDAAASETD